MDLSIVIPAFNESRKIVRDIELAGRFLIEHRLQGEIIIADDGSSDGTADIARRAGNDGRVEVSVLELPHRGKGAAVREGIKTTRGDYVLFADSGVCVPYADALAGMERLHTSECEIADGSRKLAGSTIERPQGLYRRILSGLFRRFVVLYLDLPRGLTDTQCGFKLYRGAVARELYSACLTDGFMFDLEILMRARLAGYRVVEFPVQWACDPDSRLKPARLMSGVLTDLRDLKRRLGHVRDS